MDRECCAGPPQAWRMAGNIAEAHQLTAIAARSGTGSTTAHARRLTPARLESLGLLALGAPSSSIAREDGREPRAPRAHARAGDPDQAPECTSSAWRRHLLRRQTEQLDLPRASSTHCLRTGPRSEVGSDWASPPSALPDRLDGYLLFAEALGAALARELRRRRGRYGSRAEAVVAAGLSRARLILVGCIKCSGGRGLDAGASILERSRAPHRNVAMGDGELHPSARCDPARASRGHVTKGLGDRASRVERPAGHSRRCPRIPRTSQVGGPEKGGPSAASRHVRYGEPDEPRSGRSLVLPGPRDRDAGRRRASSHRPRTVQAHVRASCPSSVHSQPGGGRCRPASEDLIPALVRLGPPLVRGQWRRRPKTRGRVRRGLRAVETSPTLDSGAVVPSNRDSGVFLFHEPKSARECTLQCPVARFGS